MKNYEIGEAWSTHRRGEKCKSETVQNLQQLDRLGECEDIEKGLTEEMWSRGRNSSNYGPVKSVCEKKYQTCGFLQKVTD